MISHFGKSDSAGLVWTRIAARGVFHFRFGTISERLFRKGRNQEIRIPREFELPGDEVLLTREGDVLTLRPVKLQSILAALKSLEPLDEALPEVRDRAPEVTSWAASRRARTR